MAVGHASQGSSLKTYIPYRPEGATRTHVVLLQGPDLADLITRGAFTPTAESELAPWLMRVNGTSLVPELSKDGAVGTRQSAERKPVTVEESPESFQRKKSSNVQVEEIGCGRRKKSSDSGYCTASSAVPPSASMLRFSDTSQDLWKERVVCEPVGSSPHGTNINSSPEIEPDAWVARSRAEHRALRRRSSAPSLGGRFRIFLEDEEDADDESIQPQWRGCERDGSGHTETHSQVVSSVQKNGRPESDSEFSFVVQQCN